MLGCSIQAYESAHDSTSRMIGEETPAALINPTQEATCIQQPDGAGMPSEGPSALHQSSRAAGSHPVEDQVCLSVYYLPVSSRRLSSTSENLLRKLLS